MAERALLLPTDRILVALSGGADSCALLLVLCELAEAGHLPLLAGVAHFHHGMRGRDADADAAFCAALAVRCGLPCVIELGALGEANEAQARDARYAFLQEAGTTLGATVIATGHHADDQAETVLLRVLRGTGLAGLAGIPPRRGQAERLTVVRPLLWQRRAELAAYCELRGIEPRQDPTNENPRYPRQRVRQLVPLLEQDFNPQLVGALNRLAEQATLESALLEELTERLWKECLLCASPLALDVATLLSAPVALRRRALLRALWRCADQQLEERATSATVARLEGLLGAGGGLDLPGGVRARVAQGRLTLALSCKGDAEQPYCFPLPLPGCVDLPDGSQVRAWWGMPKQKSARVRHAREVDCGTIAASLVVRSVASGDRIAPLGMGGKGRLVRDLLREARVPPELRARWPAVVAEPTGELLWLVGVAQSERTRVPEDATSAVILEWKRDP